MEPSLSDEILLFLNQHKNTAEYFDLFKEFESKDNAVIRQKTNELKGLGYVDIQVSENGGGFLGASFFRMGSDGQVEHQSYYPPQRRKKRRLMARITVAGSKSIESLSVTVAHALDVPIKALKAMLQEPYSVLDGFQMVRDRATIVVNRYAEDHYKHTFRRATTFNRIGEARSGEEKHRVVLVAINKAIEYFEVWKQSGSHTSIQSPQTNTTFINADTVFHNTQSTIRNQGTINQAPKPEEKKTSRVQYVVWIFTIISALIAIYGFGHSKGWW